MSTVGVVGAGHVGVVYSAGLASLGHRLQVIDIDAGRVRDLSSGHVWFHEPELPDLLGRGLSNGTISFTTSYEQGLRGCEFVFVCVPTPARADGGLDDTLLRGALERIAANVPAPKPILVFKSTVPVGSARLVREFPGLEDVKIVASPEFLAEGTAVRDFFAPARIIVGSSDHDAAERVASLFAPLNARVIVTDPITAELLKLASNAFLATKVSFANVIAGIARTVGADAGTTLTSLGLDPRIGGSHLRPGLGFGGSCLPKDLAAIQQLASCADVGAPLFAAVAEVNRRQRELAFEIVVNHFNGVLQRRTIAVLGVAFKPDTDDVRESPGALLVDEFLRRGADVVLYDPAVRTIHRARVAPSAAEAARGADAVIVATEWPEFRELDLQTLRGLMRGSLVIDGRGVLRSRNASGLIFVDLSVGFGRTGDGPAVAVGNLEGAMS